MTTPNEEVISHQTEKALDAFWEAIVDLYPDFRFGDLSPGTSIALTLAAEQAVAEWVENNYPSNQ